MSEEVYRRLEEVQEWMESRLERDVTVDEVLLEIFDHFEMALSRGSWKWLTARASFAKSVGSAAEALLAGGGLLLFGLEMSVWPHQS